MRAVATALDRIGCRLRAARDQGIRGYSYALPHRSFKGLVSRCLLKMRGQDTYRYSGWSAMASHTFRADLWSIYFRTLTLAFIEHGCGLTPSLPYVFYDLPGWGYAGTGIRNRAGDLSPGKTGVTCHA
jgi:hypothetical protein